MKNNYKNLVRVTALLKDADINDSMDSMIKKAIIEESDTIKVRKVFNISNLETIESVSRSIEDMHMLKPIYCVQLKSGDAFYIHDENIDELLDRWEDYYNEQT